MGRFTDALAGRPQETPPVWMMRQAGRYQQSYRARRRRHSFERLCRDPQLSASVAVDAVEQFDFDAGILFSDLLFPLNALGFPLKYDDSGPKLGRRLDKSLLTRLRDPERASEALAFQAEAVAATRQRLPDSKGLIGFIGGPWTLFVYATEGTHNGALVRTKQSLSLYRDFARLIVPVLARAARAQVEAGADLVMVFDTAAGELSPAAFHGYVAPDLRRLSATQPGRLGYYARGIQPAHLDDPTGGGLGAWAGLGVDWRWNLTDALSADNRSGFVQGNFDPAMLHLSGPSLRRAITTFLDPIASLPRKARRGWVCGLGHGVLPGTPESSVRDFVRTVRRRLS